MARVTAKRDFPCTGTRDNVAESSHDFRHTGKHIRTLDGLVRILHIHEFSFLSVAGMRQGCPSGSIIISGSLGGYPTILRL